MKYFHFLILIIIFIPFYFIFSFKNYTHSLKFEERQIETNEQNLIEVIIQITEFLLKDHDEGGNNKQKKKPSLIYTLNSKQTMTYLLGCNLKKILFLSNFSVNKDKSKENTIIVEKTKKQIPKEDFIKRYENFDNFKQTITNNLEIIYQNRFQIILSSNDSTIDDLVNNELGFFNIH